MSNNKVNNLYYGDTVTIGRGTAEWTVAYATDDVVHVNRRFERSGRWQTAWRHLYGYAAISRLHKAGDES